MLARIRNKRHRYLIERDFDRELTRAINMKIIVYGVHTVENKLPKIYSRGAYRRASLAEQIKFRLRTPVTKLKSILQYYYYRPRKRVIS